jgi:hypothetical protein
MDTDTPAHAAARALAKADPGPAAEAAEAALLSAIRRSRGYALPGGKVTRLAARAIVAWLNAVRPRRGGAQPGAGRPRREGGRHLRQVVLDDETLELWDAHEGDRSAWVRGLIVAAAGRREG